MPTSRQIALLLYFLPLSCLGAEIQLGLGTQGVHLAEVDTHGKTLDTETGALPQLAINLGFTLPGNWKFLSENRLSSGQLNYDGQLQNGTPYQTLTDTAFHNYRLSLVSPGFLPAWREKSPSWFVSAGYHTWKRHITGRGSVSNLNEDYDWKTLSIGIRQINPANPLNLSLGIEQTFEHQMQIDIPGTGKGQLTLPKGLGLRIGGEYQLLKTRDYRISVSLDYHYCHTPRSTTGELYKNQVKTASVVEPEHTLQTVNGLLNIMF